MPVNLLLTFGDFIKQYQLDAIAFTISSFLRCFGDYLNLPAFYVLKYFDTTTVNGLFEHSLTTAAHDNQQIYDKAITVLGSVALISSTVLAIHRNIKLSSNSTIPIASMSIPQTLTPSSARHQRHQSHHLARQI